MRNSGPARSFVQRLPRQMVLKLRYYGDPILRERAVPVEDFDDELRELAASMLETMQAERGIGLAAPQVGVLVNVSVIGAALLCLEDDRAFGIAEPVRLLIDGSV